MHIKPIKKVIYSPISFYLNDLQEFNKFHVTQLDGLRGLAALIVFASHSQLVPFTHHGIIGVLIFFSLSGFLLTKPILDLQLKFFRLNEIIAYFTRRLFRIVPAYFFVILVLFLTKKIDALFLFNHVLFVEAKWHFWTIKQEIIFYLLLPLILAPIAILKFSPLSVFILLTFLTQIINIIIIFLNTNIPYLNLQEYIVCFIYGISCALLSQYKNNTDNDNDKNNNGQRNVSEIIGLISLFVLLFVTEDTLKFILTPLGLDAEIAQEIGWKYWQIYAVISSILVYSTVKSRGFLYSFLSNKVLRIVGLCSYSFYLIHWFILDLLRPLSQSNALFLFIVAFFVTLFLSVQLYIFIEKPFIEIGRILSRRLRTRS